MLIGLHMLFNKSEHKTSAVEAEDAKGRESIAVVPLAIPLVAGPEIEFLIAEIYAGHDEGYFAFWNSRARCFVEGSADHYVNGLWPDNNGNQVGVCAGIVRYAEPDNIGSGAG